jgi:hypothetical protein
LSAADPVWCRFNLTDLVEKSKVDIVVIRTQVNTVVQTGEAAAASQWTAPICIGTLVQSCFVAEL